MKTKTSQPGQSLKKIGVAIVNVTVNGQKKFYRHLDLNPTTFALLSGATTSAQLLELTPQPIDCANHLLTCIILSVAHLI